MSNDHLHLDQQVCFPLYAASNLMVKLYRPLLEPIGLTYSQYLVMLVLWEHQSVSVGDLGQCLHLDSGTLTPLLKRMEKAGLVNRTRDIQDERRVLISLTPQGLQLREQALHIPEQLSKKIGMIDAEQLKNSLQLLVKHLAEFNSK